MKELHRRRWLLYNRLSGHKLHSCVRRRRGAFCWTALSCVSSKIHWLVTMCHATVPQYLQYSSFICVSWKLHWLVTTRHATVRLPFIHTGGGRVTWSLSGWKSRWVQKRCEIIIRNSLQSKLSEQNGLTKLAATWQIFIQLSKQTCNFTFSHCSSSR